MVLRHTLELEDPAGRKLLRIQTRVLHIRDTMEIEGADGRRRAVVHKALISPFRERWKVDVDVPLLPAVTVAVDSTAHPDR